MGLESFSTAPKNKSSRLPEYEAQSAEYKNPEDIFSGDTGADISPKPVINPSPGQETEQGNNNEAQLEVYLVRNEAIDSVTKDINNQLASLHTEQEATLLMDTSTLDELLTKRESLLQEKIQASANYPGDWTILLQNRMLEPVTKDRFITQKTSAMEHLQTGEPDPDEVGNKYGKRYASHYQSQIDNYDKRVADIFNSTNIEFDSSRKYSLGHGNINEPGTVYLNAESKKSGPLTIRQKNIIEAHEKGHGLRDYQSFSEKNEIQSVIDGEALAILTAERSNEGVTGDERFRPSYVTAAEEIIERMAQFKNYFGMSATDRFTGKHLEHIRSYYVHDTGLDNGVHDLLRCVTPNTEPAFLSVINKYAI